MQRLKKSRNGVGFLKNFFIKILYYLLQHKCQTLFPQKKSTTKTYILGKKTSIPIIAAVREAITTAPAATSFVFSASV